MCEMLAVTANDSFRINELLETFYSHSVEHKDGWGLAVFRKLSVSMEKEPLCASSSKYLHQRLSRDIIAANAIAHIRKATIGRIEYANCHPFVWDDESGRTWTLVHNGTIFDGPQLSQFVDKQEGSTDSERILMYIVRLMNDLYRIKGTATFEERFRLLERIVTELAVGNKLNLLFFDGEVLYVHCNCRGTLSVLTAPDKCIFATVPLTFDAWESVPLCQLLAYKDGELIRSGVKHSHEFIEGSQDMTSLMSMFAEL